MDEQMKAFKNAKTRSTLSDVSFRSASPACQSISNKNANQWKRQRIRSFSNKFNLLYVRTALVAVAQTNEIHCYALIRDKIIRCLTISLTINKKLKNQLFPHSRNIDFHRRFIIMPKYRVAWAHQTIHFKTDSKHFARNGRQPWIHDIKPTPPPPSPIKM